MGRTIEILNFPKGLNRLTLRDFRNKNKLLIFIKEGSAFGYKKKLNPLINNN